MPRLERFTHFGQYHLTIPILYPFLEIVQHQAQCLHRSISLLVI
jgi:hypothetical protein